MTGAGIAIRVSSTSFNKYKCLITLYPTMGRENKENHAPKRERKFPERRGVGVGKCKEGQIYGDEGIFDLGGGHTMQYTDDVS